MKKFAALFLALSMVIALCACGAAPSVPIAAETEPTASPTPEAADAPIEAENPSAPSAEAETSVKTIDPKTNYDPQTIETDAGILVIRGYSIIPQGFDGFALTQECAGYSIFTVHVTLTVKGDKPKSCWFTFQTQAFQKGIDTLHYGDSFSTDILPNTPVDLDLNFLVESATDPITFMVNTWGISKNVFTEVIELPQE